jgi:hypothetical protein
MTSTRPVVWLTGSNAPSARLLAKVNVNGVVNRPWGGRH